jgi:hypothetical protein
LAEARVAPSVAFYLDDMKMNLSVQENFQGVQSAGEGRDERRFDGRRE